jgi:hypothetical protein
MARPKRMGAYNALDDLLPGPAWDPSGGEGAAWDPSPADPGQAPAPVRRRARLEPVPDPSPARRRVRGRRGGANALDELLPGPRGVGGIDDLLPGPSAPPGRRLGSAPARDAVAHLAGTSEPTTLTALAERALRVELARLAITHNHGRPFPPREP